MTEAAKRYAGQLADVRRLSPATVRAYAGDLRDLVAVAGDIDVADIDLEVLRDWLWRRVERGEMPPGQVEELRLTRCASCGATVEFDAAIHARECPFCAAPLVSDTGTARQIKPQAQLPFLLDEAAARDAAPIDAASPAAGGTSASTARRQFPGASKMAL